VCGIELPEGLVEADELTPPIFTPASKAEIGQHDENVSFDVIAAKHGEELASKLRDRTIELYSEARAYALTRGLILADTKFEFGLDDSGELILADEVFTPDSSRYWPAEGYEPGRVQPSFDKQYVRDWLTSDASGWDRKSDVPPPPLPADVVEATRKRYIEAYERLTGRSFADWLA
jgi:phosphoribosylaminoimidazole-succinocarboxamide synthase